MITLSTTEDFSQASGIFDVGAFENIYENFIDDAFVKLGRQIIIHLRPAIEQDTNTQVLPQSQQYNPFFGRAPVSNQTPTRNAGVKVTPRDIPFSAQIKIGPLGGDDNLTGMGDLKDNEAMITVAIEALQYLKQALSVSIEGRRYSIDETRPIGFSKRKYILVKLTEIQETESPSPDETLG